MLWKMLYNSLVNYIILRQAKNARKIYVQRRAKMAKKVIVTADSTCDLSEELKSRYGIKTIPMHINLNGSFHDDMVDITPDDIYQNFYSTGTLPKTAAISIGEYTDFFKPFVDEGYEVVHINLGGALSASAKNCALAAAELEGVYPVDSFSLSTGSGLLVIEAAIAAEQGFSGREVAEKVSAMRSKVSASFIIDKLNFLRAGGRCSTLAMLGANLLSLKPCIEVVNTDGSMTVGKKYRGKLDRVLETYVNDRLAMFEHIKKDRAFITHSGISKEIESSIYELVKSKGIFDEIYITKASCTISSHCGPNTLGVLFLTE